MSKYFTLSQVEQACSALSSLASDIIVAMQLMKSDIMKPIERVLRSAGPEDLISVLQIVVQLAFTSDSVSQKMLTKDSLKSLKLLCAHKNTEVSFFLPRSQQMYNCFPLLYVYVRIRALCL